MVLVLVSFDFVKKANSHSFPSLKKIKLQEVGYIYSRSSPSFNEFVIWTFVSGWLHPEEDFNDFDREL